MSDLISREELKKHKFLTPDYIQLGGRRNGKVIERINLAYQKGWNDAIDAIYDNAPTADDWENYSTKLWDKAYRQGYGQAMSDARNSELTDRPQGEWIIKNTITRCSICNTCAFIDDNGVYKTNYCPVCGAKMKGGEEEE